MRAKDPELAESIFGLSILDGIDKWCEKYPEDFPDGGFGVPGPHNIMTKDLWNAPRGED